MKPNSWLDKTLEASVVGSFTGFGYRRRQKTFATLPTLAGKHVVITGATSGIGLAAVHGLRALGASITMIARDAAKFGKLFGDDAGISLVVADMAELPQVDAAIAQLAARPPIAALIHNAGALYASYGETTQGIERTWALHVLGPMRLTMGLADKLVGGRVIWVASGGMYTQPLDRSLAPMAEAGFDGTTAYAQAKRAQVTLADELAKRWASSGTAVVSMHPGWVDTPGVETSLPKFYKFTKRWLRTPAEGADTIVYLAATQDALVPGGFYLDRVPRRMHRGATALSDTAEHRQRLWTATTQPR